MHNMFSKAAIVCGFVLAMASCKKDETQPTVTFGDAPTLTASTANAGVLLEKDSATSAISFSWTPYKYSVSDGNKIVLPIGYTLQLAKAGTNFATPVEIPITGTTTSFNVFQLNSNLLMLKAPVRQAGQFDVRLKTVAASNVAPLYSATKTFTATPYEKCVAPNADTWALVGPAGNGWPSGSASSETGITLRWDCTANAYMARTALNVGEFKFRKDKDWAINLGGPAGNLAQGVALSLNGPNLNIATAGTYTVKLVVTGSGTGVSGGTVTVTP